MVLQGSMYFFVHEKLQRCVALRETTLRGCREVLRSKEDKNGRHDIPAERGAE